MLQTPYIHERSSSYYFRISIPPKLRASLGKREILKSLHTKDLRVALSNAAPLLNTASILFSKLYQEQIDMDRKTMLGSLGINPDEVMELAKMVLPNGVEIIVDSKGEKSVEEETKALVEQTKSLMVLSNTPDTSGMKLSELYLEYKKRKVAGWGKKTQFIYDYQFPLMIDLLKDCTARSITRQVASNLVSDLQLFPANASKLAQFQGMKPREIVNKQIQSKNPVDCLDPQTINEYLNRITALISFGIQIGECEQNYFKNLRVSVPSIQESKRLPFNEEDLKKIFHSDFYTKKQYKKSWQYWLPILGLYTGARLNELCGLTVEDIINANGVLCIGISPRPNDKIYPHSLKSAHSVRLLPIHPILDELGFSQFVFDRKKAGNTLLFDLSLSVGSYIKNPSRWFSKFKKELGILDDKKTFHSFRHTFQVQLQLTGKVSAELRSAFMGHALETGAIIDGGAAITVYQYGVKYRPQDLLDNVLKFVQYQYLKLLPYGKR